MQKTGEFMKNLSKRKIVWISILTVFLLGVLIALCVFLSNMFSFQKQLIESLDVEQLYITCDSKYYATEKEADDKEYVLSPIDMYYAKTEKGYDLKCGDLSIYDKVLYHDSIGPFLGSGSKAEIMRTEAEKEYRAYFDRVTKSLSEDTFAAPLYNYAAVTKALKEHKTLLTVKSKSGDETEYKLYFGEGFYKDVIKYVQDGKLIDFNKPMRYPVVVKFAEDRLAEVSIKINATVEFSVGIFGQTKYRGSRTFEYNVYYDYERTASVTETQKEYPYAFYENFELKTALQFSSLSFRDMKFHNGKVYLISDEYSEDRHTLDIYDLKTGALLKVGLPKNAYNVFDIVIRSDCVYIRVDPNGENKVFCYNERTGESVLYDVPALQIFFVDDQLVTVENGKKISCGADFESLTETDKYDGGNWFYFDHYSGNTYAQREIDGKTYLVKLTKNGFSENKIELPTSGVNYAFHQEGIVVREKSAVNQYGRFTKSRFILYNNELEKVKEWETELYDGDYLGETEYYVCYTTFWVDKSTGKCFGLDKVGVYMKYAIFDGVLYCYDDGAIYASDGLVVKNNY